MSVETWMCEGLPAAIILAMAGIAIATAVYEYRHPCLRYSTSHVFVPEMTTYVFTDGEILLDGMISAGVAVPVTTPAHYEDEMMCEERK